MINYPHSRIVNIKVSKLSCSPLVKRLHLSTVIQALQVYIDNMADGQLFKPEKDYTKEVDKQLPEAQELAKVRWLRSVASKPVVNKQFLG